MAKRVWASVAAFVVMALGLTLGATAVAAAPKTAASTRAVVHTGSGPVTGGVRRLGRVHSSTAPPLRSGGSDTKKSPPPTPPSPKTASPNAAYRIYDGSYGPITIPAGYWSEAWANCPSGMLATGGGESNSSNAGVTLHSTFGEGSDWKVQVTNDSGTDSTFTVYTVCMSGVISYYQATGSTSDGGGSAGTCPAGMQLLGGGGWSTNPDAILTMLIGDTWWSAAGDASGTVTAQAICGEGIGSYSRQEVNVSLASGTYQSATVTCPAGTFILGGGGYQYGVRPTDSYPTYPTQGWKIWAKNEYTDWTWNMSAIAFCGT